METPELFSDFVRLDSGALSEKKIVIEYSTLANWDRRSTLTSTTPSTGSVRLEALAIY